jgi:hypothetical protein
VLTRRREAAKSFENYDLGSARAGFRDLSAGPRLGASGCISQVYGTRGAVRCPLRPVPNQEA